MLEDIIINSDNKIINNDFNFFKDGLDNKILENEENNKSINMTIIRKKSKFDELCNLYIGSKYIQIINHKPIIAITQKFKAVYKNL